MEIPETLYYLLCNRYLKPDLLLILMIMGYSRMYSIMIRHTPLTNGIATSRNGVQDLTNDKLMKAIRYIVYVALNLLWIKGMLHFLGFLYMYINNWFIPDNYRWNEAGKIRDDLTMWAVLQFAITNVEIILFLILAYFFNEWYLKKFTLI